MLASAGFKALPMGVLSAGDVQGICNHICIYIYIGLYYALCTHWYMMYC